MAFDYNYLINFDELMGFVLYIFLACICFVFGYKLNHRNVKIKYKINKFNKKIIDIKTIKYFAIAAQIMIFLYFFYRVAYIFNNQNLYSQESYVRLLGGKETYILLLFQSALPFLFNKEKYLKYFSICICFTLGFLFAWLDASRSSVIPLIGLIVMSIMEKKYIKLLLVTSVMAMFFMAAVVGRLNLNRATFEGLLLIFSVVYENFGDITVSSFSYLTAFSMLQFAYVGKTGAGVFGVYDAIYSIVPLPSFFWPSIPDYDKWRVDFYRPMGAAAEMFRVSVFLFFLFFLFFGWLAKSVDLISIKILKIFSVCIFATLCIIIFQYNLRTSQWLIYSIVFICFIDKKISSNKYQNIK